MSFVRKRSTVRQLGLIPGLSNHNHDMIQSHRCVSSAKYDAFTLVIGEFFGHRNYLQTN